MSGQCDLCGSYRHVETSCPNYNIDGTEKEPAKAEATLLGCPFCGSLDIKSPTKTKPVWILKHSDDCFIGCKDWKRQSWFVPGSDEFNRWQTRGGQAA